MVGQAYLGVVSFTRVTTAESFSGPFERRVFVGRSFCFWQDESRALGTVIWGRPTEADIEQMIPFFEVGVDGRFRGHVSFVDGRAIEAIDALAFAKLLTYLIARRDAWGPNVGRQAVLHPSGVVGVLVAGALHVARPPYPFQCFQTSEDAFAWAGVPELRAELETLRSTHIGRPEITSRVQDVFARSGPLEATAVARALGLSRRTLQRRLREAGTTFRDEREHHLSLRIEQLLAGTDLDLDAIAADVGLSSASHLVAHFRASHGTTPGAWRAPRRPRRP